MVQLPLLLWHPKLGPTRKRLMSGKMYERGRLCRSGLRIRKFYSQRSGEKERGATGDKART